MKKKLLPGMELKCRFSAIKTLRMNTSLIKKGKLCLIPLLVLFLFSCQKKKVTVIEENTPVPMVAFDWLGIQHIPAEITFNNLTPKGDSFRWDFGNGLTSTERQPDKITYATAGTYEVILIANYRGKSAFIKKNIVIVDDPEQPVARFSSAFKDNKSYPPTTVVLTNESVNADFFEWQINGRTINSTYDRGTEQMVCAAPGKYIVKLWAKKGDKRSAVFEETITVEANPNPVASFIPDGWITTRKVGEEVVFFNTSKNSDSWEWTFGDNGPQASTDEHAFVKFVAPGTYTVKLIAKKGSLPSSLYQVNMKIIP